MSKKVVRTSLTDAEWVRVKVAAAKTGNSIEQWATDKLRAALKGAKP